MPFTSLNAAHVLPSPLLRLLLAIYRRTRTLAALFAVQVMVMGHTVHASPKVSFKQRVKNNLPACCCWGGEPRRDSRSILGLVKDLGEARSARRRVAAKIARAMNQGFIGPLIGFGRWINDPIGKARKGTADCAGDVSREISRGLAVCGGASERRNTAAGVRNARHAAIFFQDKP